MSFIRTLASLCLAALITLPSNAAAPKHPDGLIEILGAYDSTPTAAHLVMLCDAPVSCLESVVVDTSQSAYVRHRAVNLLSAFPTSASERALKRAAAKDEPFIVNAATYTFIRAFGPLNPSAVVDWAETALTSNSPEARLGAVRALRFVPGPQVDLRIDALADVEKNRRVLAAIRGFKRAR